jgi:anti-sigma regulatory factor (Ser/Thr protein kinase)
MSTHWFPAVPGSLSSVRRHVRRLADRSGLDGDDVRHVLVAVGEAVDNSVTCADASVVGVTWDPRALGVLLTVEDDGVFDRGPVWGPNPGMRLMLGVADEVEVRPGRPTWPGTVVRMFVRTQSCHSPQILLVDEDPATGHELAAVLHAGGTTPRSPRRRPAWRGWWTRHESFPTRIRVSRSVVSLRRGCSAERKELL